MSDATFCCIHREQLGGWVVRKLRVSKNTIVELVFSQIAIRNTSSYDDILLQKTKAIICQVLDNLNLHQEIQDVQALSGRETVERWSDDVRSISVSSGAPPEEKKVWPVTFEQFVQHLDCQDRFTKNLAELLVSVSTRSLGGLDSNNLFNIVMLGNCAKGYTEIS